MSNFQKRIKSNSFKLASQDESVRVGNRQRNRSLKKSPAVQDDDPTTSHHHSIHIIPSQLNTHLTPHGTEQRRAVSFDMASTRLSPAPFRPGSFDAGRSAFSPVEVPRLLVQSPLSPLQVEPPPAATDNRLLTVPSPSDFRKSPIDNRSYTCESPKTSTDIFNALSLPHNLLNQLTAAISRPIGIASPLIEEFKLAQLQKTEQMDCTLPTSTSFENIATNSNNTSFDHCLTAQSSFDLQNGIITATPEMMAQMPPKSVIQDDIRNENGRFTLIKKRGRSEVWNLFGQILDTATNARLPYVACYACKVLYTDTGGGTGNMTRHRCPMGMSYRSSQGHAEHSDTAAINPFEPPLRPQMESKVSLPSMENNGNTAPSSLVQQHSGEATIGDVDKEVLIDAIVRCCAIDMIDPHVFEGIGFRGLLEKVCTLTKKESFPDKPTIRSAMRTGLRFCTDDLKNELSRTACGVRLAVETLTYGGKDYRVIHGTRISMDFKWRSNILGVFKARETESINDMINIVVHNYDLDKNLLRVTTPTTNHDLNQFKTFIDIRCALREILFSVLNSCTMPVMSMLNTVDILTKALIELDIRLPIHKVQREDIFDVHSLLSDWNDQWTHLEHVITLRAPHLLPSFKQLNPVHLRELEAFILPFREVIESLSADQPSFHKVLPEYVALEHECQVVDNEPSQLLSELKVKASERLRIEKNNIITDEHRMAAIFNPRLVRKLDMLMTEGELKTACERIRATCGIRKAKEPLSRGSSTDGEPQRKRRMFLSSLEEDPHGDELECYLRSQYPSASYRRNLLQFWAITGNAHFPGLTSLARKCLSNQTTAPKTVLDSRFSSVLPDQLHTFLMLRSMYLTEKEDTRTQYTPIPT